jgi:heptosyltransferase-1
LKILLIKPSSLGDVVHALPTAHLLRKSLPEAHISWLLNDTLVGLLKNCPAIHAIIPFHRQRWGRLSRFPEFLQFLHRLQEQKFDIAIDLQGLFRSGVIAKGCRAPRRIGLADAREGSRWFHSETVPIPAGVTHAVDRYRQVIVHLGFDAGRIEFPFGESDQDKTEVDAFLREHGAGQAPLIALCPSARWDNKRWPAVRYGELVRELSRAWKSHRVVLIGDTRDETYLRAVAELSEASPILMAGKLPLSGLIELLRRCALYFGNDTGPTHVAAALGVPTVEIFGPTDPARTGPHASQAGHVAVVRKSLPCAPCLKPTCANTVPLECLKTIRTEEVLEVAGRLMAAKPGINPPRGC